MTKRKAPFEGRGIKRCKDTIFSETSSRFFINNLVVFRIGDKTQVSVVGVQTSGVCGGRLYARHGETSRQTLSVARKERAI